MAINLTTKYSPLIDERFRLASLTDAFAGKKYSWDGAKSIKVYSVDKVTLNNYNRSATSNRFGQVNELGDTVQTLQMTQDKAFTFSIDHGNAVDQMNIKHCNEQLKSNWDEVCTPNIDMYRFNKWANGAGIVTINGTALTKTTIIDAILTLGAGISNELVPKKNRALFIKESLYVQTKLASEILAIEPLGNKAVANGVVGQIDGMAVIPVPDSYLPTGVNFIIKYKDSTADPVKLKVLRVQKNPLGIDGDVGECRYYHDAFVLGNKAYGIGVHAQSGATAAPTFSESNGAVTISGANGATIKYTLDGSNPKTSDTASVYSSAVTVPAGATLMAYAASTGALNSAIAKYVD